MPPLMWRVAVFIVGFLEPAESRREWCAKWASNLRDWRILVERGELPVGSGRLLIRSAFMEAYRDRFGTVRFHRFLRGPLFVIAANVSALLLLALLTGGFAVFRLLLALARDYRNFPNPGVSFDPRGDRLVAYFVPVVIAAAIGLALLFLRRRALRSLGWKSSLLLAFKVAMLYVTSSLLWIEGGHALRSHIAREGVRFGLAGLGLAVVFVLAFGFATLWSISDQRRRCPVCLHRLIMPVTMGSWASIFDPAATELVCEDGHGSLALIEDEAEISPLDHWTQLDSSWQYLFRKNVESKPTSGKSL